MMINKKFLMNIFIVRRVHELSSLQVGDMNKPESRYRREVKQKRDTVFWRYW